VQEEKKTMGVNGEKARGTMGSSLVCFLKEKICPNKCHLSKWDEGGKKVSLLKGAMNPSNPAIRMRRRRNKIRRIGKSSKRLEVPKTGLTNY